MSDPWDNFSFRVYAQKSIFNFLAILNLLMPVTKEIIDLVPSKKLICACYLIRFTDHAAFPSSS